MLLVVSLTVELDKIFESYQLLCITKRKSGEGRHRKSLPRISNNSTLKGTSHPFF